MVGSSFFRFPPVVAVVLLSGGCGGVVGVSIGICINILSVWGGRDGLGTILGGCRYHIGISGTILGRVSVAATWKDCTPGGG